MIKIFESLGRNASITIIFGLVLGLMLQPLATKFKPLLLPAVWCLLAFSMYRLDYNSFLNFLKKRIRLISLIIWLLLICPILMWCIASNLPVNNGILIAMVMTAGSSPLIGAAAIGKFLKLDNTIILALIVSSTILAPITLPFIAIEFLNLSLGVEAVDLVFRLGILIGSAGLAAICMRYLDKGQNRNISEHMLDGITVVLFWLCGVALMDGVVKKFLEDPINTLMLIFLSFCVYIGLMVIGTFCAYFFWRDWRSAASLGLTSGCRNLAVIIVVLPTNIDPEIMLYFALAQFPIYLMPALLNFIGKRAIKLRNNIQ